MKTKVTPASSKLLSSLLGALPDLDMEKIYREHDLEVEQEDADDDNQSTLR
jgi:hypothetical protein